MNKRKTRALIIGSDGQDGTLLKTVLSEASPSVEIHGIEKDTFDILNFKSVTELVNDFKPTEIYYLAAYHHSSQDAAPQVSELTRKSYETHVFGLEHFLEAIKETSPTTRLFYAASSLVFGQSTESSEALTTENRPFLPDTPYGLSKTAGILTCRAYRKKHGVFASSGILFNHESYLRSEKFVTKKIIASAVRVKKGSKEILELGDLEAQVDWSDARDVVSAMRLILQHSMPDDFVVASGTLHSVGQFAQIAFEELGLKSLDWVKQKEQLLTRKIQPICGDASKLKKATGWKPTIEFRQMIRDMLTHEMKAL